MASNQPQRDRSRDRSSGSSSSSSSRSGEHGGSPFLPPIRELFSEELSQAGSSSARSTPDSARAAMQHELARQRSRDPFLHGGPRQPVHSATVQPGPTLAPLAYGGSAPRPYASMAPPMPRAGYPTPPAISTQNMQDATGVSTFWQNSPAEAAQGPAGGTFHRFVPARGGALVADIASPDHADIARAPRASAVRAGDPDTARLSVCSECGRAFDRAATLSVHMRSHTGERPFVCHVCGRAFTCLSNLYRHQRRYHE